MPCVKFYWIANHSDNGLMHLLKPDVVTVTTPLTILVPGLTLMST